MVQVINSASFCEKGEFREKNEDFIYPCGNQERIFVLCDGMGGHGHGEIASEIVGTSVFRYLKELQIDEYTPDVLQEALDFAVEQLNNADTYHDERRMGTTLVVVALNRYNVLVGHVGDSRCYLLDSCCNIKFRTRDHSMVAEAVENQILTEEEAYNSPKKNILTRSVQAGKDEKIEMTIDTLVDVTDGDYLLLCTDGVNDALRDNEIEAVLYEGILEERTLRLREMCDEKSHDNYSAIFLQLRQDEKSPSIKDTIYYCPMCGAPLVKDGKNNCAISVQTEHVEQQKVTIPSFDEDIAAYKKSNDYFSSVSHDNSEEYINIGGIKIKKKTYVLGSVWIIVGLFIFCLILLMALLYSRNVEPVNQREIQRQLEIKDRQIINQRNEYNQIIKQLQDSLAGRKDTNMDSAEAVEEGS